MPHPSSSANNHSGAPVALPHEPVIGLPPEETKNEMLGVGTTAYHQRLAAMAGLNRSDDGTLEIPDPNLG